MTSLFRVLLTLAITLLFVVASATAQHRKQQAPRVLVLLSYRTSADSALQGEIRSMEGEMRKLAIPDTGAIPMDSHRAMAINGVEVFRRANYFDSYSSAIDAYLFDLLAAQYSDPLVLIGIDSCDGDRNCLRSKGTAGGMQWVIGISEIALHTKGDGKVMTLHAQLYDAVSDSIIVDRLYTIGSLNHGFKTPCPEGSLVCTIVNCGAEIANDLYKTIHARTKVHKGR